jgi:hypothetical protein
VPLEASVLRSTEFGLVFLQHASSEVGEYLVRLVLVEINYSVIPKLAVGGVDNVDIVAVPWNGRGPRLFPAPRLQRKIEDRT